MVGTLAPGKAAARLGSDLFVSALGNPVNTADGKTGLWRPKFLSKQVNPSHCC